MPNLSTVTSGKNPLTGSSVSLTSITGYKDAIIGFIWLMLALIGGNFVWSFIKAKVPQLNTSAASTSATTFSSMILH